MPPPPALGLGLAPAVQVEGKHAHRRLLCQRLGVVTRRLGFAKAVTCEGVEPRVATLTYLLTPSHLYRKAVGYVAEGNLCRPLQLGRREVLGEGGSNLEVVGTVAARVTTCEGEDVGTVARAGLIVVGWLTQDRVRSMGACGELLERVEHLGVAVGGVGPTDDAIATRVLEGGAGEGQAELAVEAEAEVGGVDGGGGGARRGAQVVAGTWLGGIYEVGCVAQVVGELRGGEEVEPVVVVEGMHVGVLE